MIEKSPSRGASSVEWARRQRHQVFASQWAQAGHDVFYREYRFRDISFGDFPRLWRKARRLFFERAGENQPSSRQPARRQPARAPHRGAAR